MRSWSYWVTVVSMIIATVVLVSWDIYAAVNKSSGDTISEITLYIAKKHAIIPLIIGTVCGHFFSPVPRFLTDVVIWSILISLGVVVIILDLIHLKYGLGLITFLEAWPMITFMVGVALGAVVWTQGG